MRQADDRLSRRADIVENERCWILQDTRGRSVTKNSGLRERTEARLTASQVRARREREEEARAGYERTAKLKLLRLAKEDAEKAAAAAKKAQSPPARKR